MGTKELQEIGKLARTLGDEVPRFRESRVPTPSLAIKVDHSLRVLSDGRSSVDFSLVEVGESLGWKLDYAAPPPDDVQLQISPLSGSRGCRAWRLRGTVGWSDADREFLASRSIRVLREGADEPVEVEVPRMSPSVLFDRRTIVLEPVEGGSSTVLRGIARLSNLLERPITLKIDANGLPIVSGMREVVLPARGDEELEFLLDARSLVSAGTTAREIGFDLSFDGDRGTRTRLSMPVDICCPRLGEILLLDETPQVFGRVDAGDRLSCRIGYLRGSDGSTATLRPVLAQHLEGGGSKKLNARLETQFGREETIGEGTYLGHFEVSFPADVFLESGSFGVEIRFQGATDSSARIPVRAYPGRLSCPDHGESGIQIEIPEDATALDVAGVLTMLLENRLDAGTLDMRFGSRIGNDYCSFQHVISSDRLVGRGNSITRRMECDFHIDMTLPSKSFEIQLPAELRARWQPGTIECFLPVQYRMVRRLIEVVTAQYTPAKKKAMMAGREAIGRFRVIMRRTTGTVSTFKVKSAVHSSCEVRFPADVLIFAGRDEIVVDLILLRDESRNRPRRNQESHDVRLQELQLNIEVVQVTASGLRVRSNSACVIELL